MRLWPMVHVGHQFFHGARWASFFLRWLLAGAARPAQAAVVLVGTAVYVPLRLLPYLTTPCCCPSPALHPCRPAVQHRRS